MAFAILPSAPSIDPADIDKLGVAAGISIRAPDRNAIRTRLCQYVEDVAVFDSVPRPKPIRQHLERLVAAATEFADALGALEEAGATAEATRGHIAADRTFSSGDIPALIADARRACAAASRAVARLPIDRGGAG